MTNIMAVMRGARAVSGVELQINYSKIVNILIEIVCQRYIIYERGSIRLFVYRVNVCGQ